MNERRTARGHLHAEAFCLMTYACRCGHRETIWNSRDGVTPFAMVCPSCGASYLQHVNFSADVYSPRHVPHHGQRVWVDMTKERATQIADARIAMLKADGRIGLNGGSVTGLRERLIQSFFEHGSPAPDLVITGYGELSEPR